MLAVLLPYWKLRVMMLVSLHGVIAATGSSDLGVFLAAWTIPPINSSENYMPPQADSPENLDCQCNSVIYKIGRAHV